MLHLVTLHLPEIEIYGNNYNNSKKQLTLLGEECNMI